jgi:TetR/AcrR family transcriptional regulator
MVNKEINTENKILEAAKLVFIKKGLYGARMQEIADEAGINKSLLHYYFRSKDKLFLAVFSSLFATLFNSFNQNNFANLTFEEKITLFLEKYTTLLINNPYLPGFIIQEINHDPDNLANTFNKMGINPEEKLIQFFGNDLKTFQIRDTREFIINILSLCIFPIIAKPLLERVLFKNNANEFSEFIKQRPSQITKLIINNLK